MTKEIKNRLLIEKNKYGKIIDLIIKTNNINAQDNLNFTLLMFAISFKDKNLVEFLLQHDANPNMQNHYGSSPLIITIATIQSELNKNSNKNDSINLLLQILETLIKYGGNPSLQDYNNHNAYYHASFLPNEKEIITILNLKEQIKILRRVK